MASRTISKWTRDTVSSASTRSFSGALPTRITSPAITNSVPRCGALDHDELAPAQVDRRPASPRAGSASRVRCSIAHRIVPSNAAPAVAIDRCARRESTACIVLRSTGSTRSIVRARRRPTRAGVGCGRARRPRRARSRAPARPSDAPLPSCLDQTIGDELGAAAQAARRPEARLPASDEQDRARRARRPVRRRPDVVELDRRRRRSASSSPRTSASRPSFDVTPLDARPRRAARRVLRRRPVRAGHRRTSRSATSCGRRSTPSSRWAAASSTPTSCSPPAAAGCSTTACRASRSTPASRSTCSSRSAITIRFDVRDLMAVQETVGRDPLHQQPRRDRRARAVDPDRAVMRALVVARPRCSPARVAADGDGRAPTTRSRGRRAAAADADAAGRARPRCASIRRSPTGSRSSASGAARSIACSSSRPPRAHRRSAATTRRDLFSRHLRRRRLVHVSHDRRDRGRVRAARAPTPTPTSSARSRTSAARSSTDDLRPGDLRRVAAGVEPGVRQAATRRRRSSTSTSTLDLGVGVVDSKTSRGAAGVVGFGIKLFVGQGGRVPARRPQPHVPPGAARRALPGQRRVAHRWPVAVPAVQELSATRRRSQRHRCETRCALTRRLRVALAARRGRSRRRRRAEDEPRASAEPAPAPSAARRRRARRRRRRRRPRRRRRRRRHAGAAGSRGAGRGARPRPSRRTSRRRPADVDVDALRQEYLTLRDELFKSRARAHAVASQLYSTRSRSSSTYTQRRASTASRAGVDPARRRQRLRRRRRARSPATTASGSTASSRPGRHLVTFRVEATGKDDERFTSATESADRGQGGRRQGPRRRGARPRTAATSPTSGRSSEQGSYGLGIDVAVKTAGARRRRRGEASERARSRRCSRSRRLALGRAPRSAQRGAGASRRRRGRRREPRADDDPIAKYFAELEAMKLIDVESGNARDAARASSQAAEALLARRRVRRTPRSRSTRSSKSPRYAAFTDFVEYQNAEYDLGVALARAGRLRRGARRLRAACCARGPAAPYWGPAHRRAVDIALETRDHAGVLARLEAIKTDRADPAVGGRRARLPARPRRLRRRQARRRRGRARRDLAARAGCTRRRSTCAA